ncbi:hypothetical protein [Streptomyces longhuiensis]|uniref:hypothetical protein n=1 Tax=Streptomyces longhuiensis TaxID=2880933 RepID=UPI001D09D9D0|nr:hypothetical protein [Streptomyces longhuiensis]UDM03246.1 hypothetical protein LGI35_35800 [Streptomyces longhuiensis]
MSDGTGDAPQSAAAGVGAAAGSLTASLLAAGGAAVAQAMRVEGETLSAFKRRVDELLRNLEKSKAAPKSIANGALPAGRLGAFDEADALHSAYTHVHSQLENLSKMLALQIEGLVVTVDASKAGYGNLDDDIRARLSRIRTQADALVGPGTKAAPGSDHGGSGGASGGEPMPKATDSEAGGL